MTDSTQDALLDAWLRVRIQGTLTLRTPLVLKNGAARAGHKLKDGTIPEVMEVLRTRDGRAAIPGSSLKGVLRSEIERLGGAFASEAVLDVLFGRRSAEKADGEGAPDQGRGGSVEFGFALSKEKLVDPDDAIEHVVAIDRVRHAAADRLLFATETIPTGTVFDVCLTGYGLSREHVTVLLSTLERFNDTRRPLALGSATASDYGRAEWVATSVMTLSADDLAKWTETPADQPLPDVWSVAQQHPPESFVAGESARAGKSLDIDVTLAMDGWFLVRDPRQSKAIPPRSNSQRGDNQKPPDALPRCVLNNGVPHVALPARSVRGVLRSQVERIARTLAPRANVKPGPLVDDSGSPAQSLVAALFGGVGGRTALSVDTFIDPHPAEEIIVEDEAITSFEYPALPPGKTTLWQREFVAVDRFTGGAAEQLKFNCRAAWKPQLKGTLSIDLDDLNERCKAIRKKSGQDLSPAAALGLFLLALRDLNEGDLSFGMGAAKGWGRAEDALLRASVDDNVATSLEELAGGAPSGLPRPTGAFQLFDDAWFRAIAQSCVRAAREQLPTEAGATP